MQSSSTALVCGCPPRSAPRPHVAVAFRAAAMLAMTDLWKTLAKTVSAGACVLRYEADHVVGLVPHSAEQSFELRVAAWHQQVSVKVGSISAGRSAPHAGAAGLSQALREALCALDLGERLRGPGCLTAYGEIFALDYATRLMRDHRLDGVYDQVPSRLGTFDQSEGGELMSTLEAFLAAGSLQATAAQLGIHRNTVHYRLKRIEQITRIDLANAETRFMVHLALRAHRHLASEPG